MRVMVVYKQAQEYTSEVEQYMADFTRQTGLKLETLDPEAPGSAGFCEAYDIVEYPTIVALSNDGQVQNTWRGLPLPMISEVSYYAGAN